MRTGVANVPLHGGHCPPWLFEKMKQLGAVMIEVIVIEYGPAEVLRRLSDPVWFQAFGSVLGFDWHSSGLTTVVCGALKEGLRDRQGELGLFFAGGKGGTSRRTPEEIVQAGEAYGLSNDLAGLTRTSRLVAKVDSAAVQDGYELYHHFFAFDREGNWAVVQQGMNEANRYARRYHWLSETVQSYVEEPHQAICGRTEADVLNLVSRSNEATRLASVELCREKPEAVAKVLAALSAAADPKQSNASANAPQQLTLFDEEFGPAPAAPADAARARGGKAAAGSGRADAARAVLGAEPAMASGAFTRMTMPRAHPIPAPRYLDKILRELYEKPPASYERLLETPGVGASTLRALAMVAEVTHGAQPTYADPVRYAFAHGGKDSYPFPVQARDLEHSLAVLRTAVEKAKLGERDKLDALRRLALQEETAALRMRHQPSAGLPTLHK